MGKKVNASIQLALLLQWLCCNHLNIVLGFNPSLSTSKLTLGNRLSRQRSITSSFLSLQESHDDYDCDSAHETVTNLDHEGYWDKQYRQKSSPPTRRQLLQKLSKAIGIGGGIATMMMTPYSSFSIASAEEDSNVVASSGSVTLEELSSRLRMVPTFSVVDKRGVPFMVFGEDAKLTAYFFTSYKEASRILRVASDSSDKAIALDFAVTLANKGKLGGAYFRIAPSEDDIEDALSIDKSSDDLSEGKVPLFYLDNFELKNTEKKQIPLYFRKSELLQEWKRQNPNEKSPPNILVTELFSVITEMVSPKTESTDPDIEYLTFIPPKESSMMQNKCIKQGGKEKPFILGERIVVL